MNLATASQVGEPSTPSQSHRLTIRLYNYTNLRPAAIDKARNEVNRLLATAGISVRWERCRTSDDETDQDRSCAQRAGAHVIQLRVHPEDMAKKLTGRGVEFGYSIPLDSGRGVIAGVYLDRTAAMAKRIGAELHIVLGHTMAHEIGHLLIGTNSHSRRGIMLATWGDREVQMARTGVLSFTAEQAHRMQAQVDARLKASTR